MQIAAFIYTNGGIMATTRIKSVHINKGKTPRQCIATQLDYIMNPAKTDGGLLVSSHACVPETAADEFMLYRKEYLFNTGREIKNEVLVYHVRQAFKPGEITPEEANAIGMELAEKLTDNQHAYVVATHVDKHHVHNHIVICSIALDCQHKYRDVKWSGKDLAQLSDELCEAHQLSVIHNPQNKTVSYDKWQGNQKKFTHRDSLRMMIDAALRMQPDGFDALMQLLEDVGCLIKRGTQISIKPPDGERYIRLDTLGPEYEEAALCQTLAGEHIHIPKIPRADYTKSQVKRLVDIETKMLSGKGKGYQVWAERNNIDAKAQSIIFLKENHIGSYTELENQILELQDHQIYLKSSLREKQNRMKEINQQRQAIRDYRRTKDVYSQYRESNWSPKFYQEHRQEIEAYKKAQTVYSEFNRQMPTLKELTAEYDALREQSDADKAALDELKPKLQALKNTQYNFRILQRDITPETHQTDRHWEEQR